MTRRAFLAVAASAGSLSAGVRSHLRLEAIAAARLPLRMELTLEGASMPRSRFLELRQYQTGDVALRVPAGAILCHDATLLLPFDDLAVRAVLWSQVDSAAMGRASAPPRLIAMTLFRVTGGDRAKTASSGRWP